VVSVPTVAAREVAAAVPDPELPFLTVADLGILRDVTDDAGKVVVTVTPTYSGCPALTEIQRDIARRLADAGFGDVRVRIALAPAWTTDWITAEGRRKLAEAGIAPPVAVPATGGGVPVALVARRPAVACPSCGSGATSQVSPFAATACKALYRCQACREPFEYMREH
jgi:ring-1,2-phenylacetyl-CoA epoxidase subunit PaaD